MATYSRNQIANQEGNLPAVSPKALLPSQDISSIIVSSFNTVKETMSKDNLRDVTNTGSSRILSDKSNAEDAKIISQENERKLVDKLTEQNHRHNEEKARSSGELEKKDSEEKKKKDDKNSEEKKKKDEAKQIVDDAKAEIDRKYRKDKYEALVSKTTKNLAEWTSNPLAGTSKLLDVGIQKVATKSMELLNTPIGELFGRKKDKDKDKGEDSKKDSNSPTVSRIVDTSVPDIASLIKPSTSEAKEGPKLTNTRLILNAIKDLKEVLTGKKGSSAKGNEISKEVHAAGILSSKDKSNDEMNAVIDKLSKNAELSAEVSKATLDNKEEDSEFRKLQMSSLIEEDQERKKNEQARSKAEKDGKEARENSFAAKLAQQSIAGILTKISLAVLGLATLAVVIPVIVDKVTGFILDAKALPGKFKAWVSTKITAFVQNLKSAIAELFDKINLVNPFTGTPYKIFSTSGMDSSEKAEYNKMKELSEDFSSEYKDADLTHAEQMRRIASGDISIAGRKAISRDDKETIDTYAEHMKSLATNLGVITDSNDLRGFEIWKQKMESDEEFKKSQISKFESDRGKAMSNRELADIDFSKVQTIYDKVVDYEEKRYQADIAKINEDLEKKIEEYQKKKENMEYEHMTPEEKEKFDAELKAMQYFVKDEYGKYGLGEAGSKRQKELDDKRDESLKKVTAEKEKEMYHEAILEEYKKSLMNNEGQSEGQLQRTIEQWAKTKGYGTEKEGLAKASAEIMEKRKEWAAEWDAKIAGPAESNPFNRFIAPGFTEKLHDSAVSVSNQIVKSVNEVAEAITGVEKTLDGKRWDKEMRVFVKTNTVKSGTPIN